VIIVVNKQDVVDRVLCGMADDPFQVGTPFKGHTKEGIGIGSSRAEVKQGFRATGQGFERSTRLGEPEIP
jgi:hypothetical protein